LFGDDVSAAADAGGLRGAGAHLHARARAAVRGASDHRDRVGAGEREAAALGGDPLQPGRRDRAGGGDARGRADCAELSLDAARRGDVRVRTYNRAAFARALGLAESDLLAGAPICTGSTGNTFLYVPLRDRDAVDRARLDVPALLAAQGEGPNLGLFVFAPDPDPHARRVYSRMFAPHTSGVPEDPATGSASGALGAYLIERGLVAAGSTVDIVSEQGTRMGRQSFIQIRIATSAGRITEILVGGRVVPVIEGRLRVP